ncbi:transporter substrate-binding domain-containing protein [Bradyrhizobium sp. LHD-71]|uniref:transporter substrate-binding domain-containing protein n=1 Tax=Bradyrhizobium sp. LHD-71 TaxID=3072141 RepID=UPI00280D7D13|nr:transporter substrate-binding domain-containing protein [Bradyrhizobium sp. LHD-71]MDQ8730201.1 transporter substrate-binding domain-containing protein [Bradyrhizobium sp. LHD-71]
MKRAATILVAFAMLLLPSFAGAQATVGVGISPQGVLNVGVKDAPPFAMKRPDGDWQGISIDLWRKLAQDAGLAFRFVEAPTVNGLIEGAANGSFDIAVAALTVTAGRERVVDFTHSYYVSGLGIAVPAEGVMSWTPVVRAITSFGFIQAVLALVGLALATGFAVWLCERRRNESFSGGVARGLTSSVWWSTLAMTQRSPTGSGPMTLPGRLIAIIWMVTSIVALAVFTAGVTSVLTTRQLQGAVNGVGDLGSVHVGTVAGTAAEETLARMNVGNVGFATPIDGLKALRRGEIDAFVYDRPLLAWHIRQGDAGSVSAIRLLDVLFDPQSYAFALPNGSPLREQLSIAILSDLQSDWWTQTRSRYLGAN